MKTTPTRERIGRAGQRRQVVIPREILDTLNLQAGDFVAFAAQKNGEAQLKRGESKSWRVVKDALSL